MVDKEDIEELRQTLLDESDARRRQDFEEANIEQKLRTDYEFFIDDGNEYYLAIKALNNLKKKCKMYDWVWDISLLDDDLNV